MEVKSLSLDLVLELHTLLIDKYGGLDGVRDPSMLDASLNSYLHTFGGTFLYPTIQAMAAHFAFSLVKNHPFLDGNKRTGMLSMLVFLELNGQKIQYTDDDLITLGLGLANGDINETDVIDWISSHTTE
jgi:death-on-curing protein